MVYLYFNMVGVYFGILTVTQSVVVAVCNFQVFSTTGEPCGKFVFRIGLNMCE